MLKNRYSFFSLFLTLLALVGIFGSVGYLIIGLTTPVRIIVVLLSIISTIYLKKYFPLEENRKSNIKLLITSGRLLAIYGFLGLLGLYQIIHSQSGRPLITPWETLPHSHFIIYGLATLCLYMLLPRIERKISGLLSLIHYGWSYCFAVIIYKIGYGFDPFIHQATVQAIEQLGKIYPTTFYYLGQYSLITTLHLLFSWTIAWWDKLLVPVLATLLIPTVLYKKITIALQYRGLIILSLLILPFSIFIVTTPQNLAYVFLIIIIFYSLHLQPGDLIIIWLLAILALLTQPIAGLPALLFATWLTIKNRPETTYKKVLVAGLVIAFTLAIPLALYIFSHQYANGAISFTNFNLTQLFSFLVPTNPHRESIYLNLVYFFASMRGLIFAIIIIAGITIAHNKKISYIYTYGLPAGALIVSATITSLLNFGFLINYERFDYAHRLITVAVIFCLPFIVLVLENFFIRLAEQKKYIQTGWLICLATLVTSSLYLSYPRFDHYFNSHGYASSDADVTAVHWINQQAGDSAYIVLANQQTSAVAIREFGFKKYYNNLFYYPVPTGGPLYQYYLAMVKEPNRESIDKAMALAGVNQAYFVLNEYWFNAKKIGPEIKAIADETTTLQDNQITVYTFKK